MNREFTFEQVLGREQVSENASEDCGLKAMFVVALASFVVSGLYFVGTLV